jgi:hypothetical protein
LESSPSWEKQVIKATTNTFFHFLERFAMCDAPDGEGGVHHFMA